MLTTEQAAKELGCDAKRVRDLVKAGVLPATHTAPGNFRNTILIQQSDLALALPHLGRKRGRPKKGDEK